MAISKDSLQSKFKAATKTVTIEAIGDEVVVRALTLQESNEVNALMFANAPAIGKDQQISINPADYSKAALKGVGFGLVEPKLKKNELAELSRDATEFINEVFNAIEKSTNEENEKTKKN